MKYLLDTNACVSYLRQGANSKIFTRLQQLGPSDAGICSVVKAELLFGALRSNNPQSQLKLIASFIGGLNSLPFDDRAADEYAELRAYLAKLGKPIGPNDLLIAAIAISNAVTLVTANTNEFSRVPRLTLENWEA